MDVSIRSVADASALTGQPFEPGQRVWSYLSLGSGGELERKDVAENDLLEHEAELPEKVVCRWSQVYKERDHSAADARRAAALNAEELLLHLLEAGQEEEPGDASVVEARERLQFMLALQLERRRILRSAGPGRYVHIKTKRVLSIPQLEITPELIRQLHQELESLPGS